MPPPPVPYPGFQPAGPSPAGLVQMELNLHHHIESCFGSLMRLTTDNTDRMIDKMVRGTEESRDINDTGLKLLKSEMKDFRKELNGMRKELANGSQTDDQMKESIGSMGRKLDGLDEKMGEIGLYFQRAGVEASESEREEPSTNTHTRSRSKGSPRRRSRSTHASGSSRHYATSGSASTQHSMISSRAAARRSDERNINNGRKEVSASTDGVAPDIRDHPAYRGVVEAPGPSSPIYQTPDYGEIWYQQAYGQRP